MTTEEINSQFRIAAELEEFKTSQAQIDEINTARSQLDLCLEAIRTAQIELDKDLKMRNLTDSSAEKLIRCRQFLGYAGIDLEFAIEKDFKNASI